MASPNDFLPQSTVTEGAGDCDVGTASEQVCAATPLRREFTAVNDSDTIIYLALGEAAVVGKGIRLNAEGGSYTTTTFTGAINAIHGGSGDKNLCYVEV